MRLIISAIVFCLMLVPAGLAQAHRVSVYAYVEDGQVKGEGYMPGGGKVSNQTVQILNAEGKVLAEGKTKADGSFALPLPKAKAPLQVVLLAGPGHRASFELKAADLGQTGQEAAPTAPAPAPAGEAKQAPAVGINPQELGALIQKNVTKSLAPLRSQLAEMALHSQEVTIKDIVSGLGWIVGLLGLAAYLKARKLAKAA